VVFAARTERRRAATPSGALLPPESRGKRDNTEVKSIRRRTFLAAIPLALAMRAAAAQATSGYRAIDLMPEWWAFVDDSRGLDPDAQARLFLDTVVRRHPKPYAATVIGLDPRKPYEEQLLERFQRLQKLLAGREPLMRQLSASIAADLPRYEASFRRTFPDFRYDGEIYFMHSLGGFDGATREVDGHTALLFGIDMIAYVYGTDADVEPFFHHELFHLYHSQFDVEHRDRDPVYFALWREGLATYVAQTLNPGAGGVAIFGLPRSMPEQTRSRLPELARALLADLDSTSPDDYGRWFLDGSQAPVPARSGYYIGFLVARNLAARHSLPELARLPIASLRGDIAAALEQLAR
jgi:hypothetical protein